MVDLRCLRRTGKFADTRLLLCSYTPTACHLVAWSLCQAQQAVASLRQGRGHGQTRSGCMGPGSTGMWQWLHQQQRAKLSKCPSLCRMLLQLINLEARKLRQLHHWSQPQLSVMHLPMRPGPARPRGAQA